ncbi:MAG: LLM class F420-dependent oxidoreductase [Pseudomonadota bacterium]
MKLSVTTGFSHHTPPDYIAGAAQFLESLEFHALWVPEHVLFFPDYASRYPYSDDGRIPGEPEGVLDPFSALTFVAAHTTRLRLGTGICLVPQRQPVYTARMVADLDYLSGGRVDFGVGIGWLREEFEALQMSYADRAANTREYLAAMRALWAPGESEFSGETVTIQRCHFNPKPVQQGARFGGPPVYFGGESPAALRRVAEIGDGWYGFNLTPELAAEKLKALDAALTAAGRDRSDVAIAVGAGRVTPSPETAQAFADLGVDQLIVPVGAPTLEKLKPRAERVREMLQA